MEVAIIDWKTINSKFVKDDLYEHINAPQWIDFSAPNDSIDDEAWFCRPDCNHPKTVEDFFRRKPPSKLQMSDSVRHTLPLVDRNQREQVLKKRGLNQPSTLSNKDLKFDRLIEGSENQNPNFSTPPNGKARFFKEAVKSSSEKKMIDVTSLQKEEAPKLKSTLSARNLFSGKDIFGQVTEFCNELKRLAMRAKERETRGSETANEGSTIVKDNEQSRHVLWNIDEKEKEKTPLLEVVGIATSADKSSLKNNLRKKKRTEDAENLPVRVDLNNIKGQCRETLIRTCPPSPQCFSAKHGHNKGTPSKAAFRPRPPLERGILQEIEQSEVKKEDIVGHKSSSHSKNGSIVAAERGGEAKSPLDVFWFLRPCTLSS